MIVPLHPNNRENRSPSPTIRKVSMTDITQKLMYANDFSNKKQRGVAIRTVGVEGDLPITLTEREPREEGAGCG